MHDIRLIDANALKSEMTVDALGGHKRIWVCGVIDDAQTIDAQPVKHGKWVRDASGELNCSYCGYAPKWDDDKFCANCGAKMDGDADEN